MYAEDYTDINKLHKMFSNIKAMAGLSEIKIDFKNSAASFSTLARDGKAPEISFSNIPSEYKLMSLNVTDNSKGNDGWASKAVIIANFSSDKYPEAPYAITFNWTNQAATQTDAAKIDEKNNPNANTNTNNYDHANMIDSSNANIPNNNNIITNIGSSSDSQSNELVQTGIDDSFSFLVPFAAASVLSAAIPIIKRRR